MIGRQIGRFRILEKLGEGGMAQVWKAHDTLLDRTVALKTLSRALAHEPEARRRFHHEAEIAAGLDHPGIAAIYATGEERDVAYLAMAFIEGEPLSERVARRLMPISEAVEIVSVAAAALGYAHARGVVHRDVTSRNIMVARDGRVFVLDFGLAIAAGISRITSRNTTVGTIAYMAPELLAGNEADVRSDLYGLGVVFYEALTGTLPFAARTADVLKYAALNQEARAPRALRPEIPPELERIALRAIGRDPAGRYQSAEELMRDLHAAAADASVESAPAGAGSPGARLIREGDPVHLAVLPIETPGDVAEDADGMRAKIRDELAAALRGALASVGRIHVVAAPDGGPSGTDVSELSAYARRAGAHLLLRSALRRQGSRLHLVYELLDPETGVQIGGGTVGGSVTERFDFEDRAIADVRGALGSRPRRAAAEVPRARDPAADDRYAQALAYLRRYDNEASVDGAIRVLEQLIAADGERAAYHATLARAFLHKHALTQERLWEGRATAAVERARRIAPEDPEVLLACGELQYNVGNHEAALGAFEAVLRGTPDRLEALLGAARAQVGLGRSQGAEEVCRRAIAAHPDDWRGYSHLGWVFDQRGDAAAAVAPWTRVIELTPDNAKGRRNLGSAYYRLNRFDDAVSAYRDSLAVQPNPVAYRNLGTALYYLGRYEEAVPALRRATELAPSDPVCWGNLASTCNNLADQLGLGGYRQEARQALDRAIGLMRERLERNPNVAESWAFLAGWLADRGHFAEAQEAIRHALRLDPRDLSCMVRAGHVSFRLGDPNATIRWLRDAVRGGYPVGELARSLEFAPLREHPDFIRLLESVPTEGTSTSSGSRERVDDAIRQKGDRQ